VLPLFLNASRGSIHYRLESTSHAAAPATVFIHGLGANLSYWYSGVLSLLKGTRSILTYDLRGHGCSEPATGGYSLYSLVQDLRELLDSLGLHTVELVGHSHGGIVASAFSVLFPSRVSRLVLLDSHFNCSGYLPTLASWPYWSTLRDRLPADSSQLPADDSVIDFRLLLLIHDLSFPASKSRSRNSSRSALLALLEQGGTAFSLLASEIKDQSLLSRDSLASIAIPVLAIYGEHSHCLPSSDLLSSVLTDLTLVILPDAGHFFPQRYPLRVSECLHSFLQS
jgi:pimeloyl-ACP methyl ester carboxylesterase